MQVFTDDLPGVYLKSQIYDKTTNPSGNIIPKPNSLVIDEDRVLWTVDEVDLVNGTVTYLPISAVPFIPEEIDDTDTTITKVEYSNSRMYLYWAEETVNDNGGYKLNVSKSLVVVGDDVASFDIVRLDPITKEYVSISMHFDSNGTYTGDKVPFIDINQFSHLPTSCHSTTPIIDDASYLLRVFDYTGIQCGEFRIYGKKAIVNNTLLDDKFIVGMYLEGTQHDSEGFYIYTDQDPKELVVVPKLIYKDGSTKSLTIDNNLVQVYGLDEFIPSSAGQSAQILVKYFLNEDEQASTNQLVTNDNVRRLEVYDTIKVIDGDNEKECKISVVPRYVEALGKYTLLCYLYTLNSDEVINITPAITLTGFDGTNVSSSQNVVISFNLNEVYDDVTYEGIYEQSLYLRLRPYNVYERYVIASSEYDIYGVYGTESVANPRPVIYKQSDGDHVISNVVFDNVTKFLERFYYVARPIYTSSTLAEPITPTHFAIKNPTNGNLVSEFRLVSEYDLAFPLLGNANLFDDTNCMVEFYNEIDGVKHPLYGTPVDVIDYP